MPFSTGLIYNPPSSADQATQLIVTCVNDSLNIPANIEIQVFRWDTSQAARIPIGHNLFQLRPQVSETLLYPLTSAAYIEVQSDYFSATSTVIHAYTLDSTGVILQRVLQSEMVWVDRFTNIP
ncbi:MULTISPECIES: hypothetical protein [Paenibacillus]|uniref:hypothetical protein n=1 Tax=Paenibacillus TaxID=44249 RepID=UPI0020000526|nr:hypothetical protein [Paenibacillus pabuli]UPK41507.1 hypothetical protein KET34_19830 [Paenibacillus pabuli]